MEATIACGWGYLYSVPAQTHTGQQIEWLQSILAYINNGEANKGDFTFEENIREGLSATAITELLNDADFRRWAGNEVIEAIKILMTRRGQLLRQPPSFFSPDSMFQQSAFKRYWTARESALRLLQRKFRIRQEENGVDCN